MSTSELTKGLDLSPVVNETAWIEAGQKLLAKEKAFTKARDEINRQRREMPWVRVEKDYIFDSPEGKKSLSDLFDGKSQLIVYHCMFGPGDEPCPGCSFICDHVDAARMHFEHHDIAFAAISRANYGEFIPFKKRMGWTFPWLSSAENTFNYDFSASFRPSDLEKGPVLYNFKMQTLRGQEQPGLTVFAKGTDGNIYRTYSTYERGLDMLLGAYHYIDLTPLGRNEKGPMDWVSLHDEYKS